VSRMPNRIGVSLSRRAEENQDNRAGALLKSNEFLIHSWLRPRPTFVQHIPRPAQSGCSFLLACMLALLTFTF
jgi:hypothetical protein